MKTKKFSKAIWGKFKDLKIRDKLLISNIGVILIMLLVIGGMGYVIARNILISRAVKSSEDLMEQLSSNFSYAVESLEDMVSMQTYSEKFSDIVKTDESTKDKENLYGHKKAVESYCYNLMGFNRFIKTVIIQDDNGDIFYVSSDGKSMSESEKKECLDADAAYEFWGDTLWSPYDSEQVFASRLMFDYQSMKPLGIIAVGIDTEYFEDLYKNIVEDESSDIIVLNHNQEILMESSAQARTITAAILEKYAPEKESGKDVYYGGEKYIYTTWKTDGSQIQVMNLISEKKVSKVVLELLNPLLVAAACAVILSGLLAFGISRQISLNIRLLLENIRKISEGDFSQKIKPEGYDEIGMLAIKFNEMSEKICRLLETVTNEKIMKKNSQLKALEFEYDALQAKINPHFLYNTLESINSLAKLKGEDEIADSIYLLGNYLREAISSKKKFVTLEEEIQNIENYVRIQQLSYGEKIQIEIQCEEALEEIMVPKLILQPLVENAIVHGIEPKIGVGKILISAEEEEKDLVISVSDNGVGIPKDRLCRILDGSGDVYEGENGRKHTKVGLMAVHKRIRILYGERYGIDIQSEEQIGSLVRVRLPIKFEDEVDTDEL